MIDLNALLLGTRLEIRASYYQSPGIWYIKLFAKLQNFWHVFQKSFWFGFIIIFIIIFKIYYKLSAIEWQNKKYSLYQIRFGKFRRTLEWPILIKGCTALNLLEKFRNQNISDPFTEPLKSQLQTQINKIKGENTTIRWFQNTKTT